MKANAICGDPGWCGHPFVSLRTWTCADCDRKVTHEARRCLESTPTVAPAGWVWVFQKGKVDADEEEGHSGLWVIGVFSDRSRIAASLVRGSWYDAASIREAMRGTHWYQGAINEWIFEGYAEEPDRHGDYPFYSVEIERIDHPGDVVGSRRDTGHAGRHA